MSAREALLTALTNPANTCLCGDPCPTADNRIDNYRAEVLAEAAEKDCPQPAPDFFQPGHTYADTDPSNDWQFRCDAIVRHPEDGERTALGWRHFKGEWETCEYGEGDWEIQQIGGHTDVTETGGAR